MTCYGCACEVVCGIPPSGSALIVMNATGLVVCLANSLGHAGASGCSLSSGGTWAKLLSMHGAGA